MDATLLLLTAAGLLAILAHRLRGQARVVTALGRRVAELERANADLVAENRRQQVASIERDRLVAVLEATTDVVSIVDPDGRLLYLNPAGHALGAAAQRTDIDSALPRMHPDWAVRRITQEGLPSAIRDGSWVGETALLDAQGNEIPVSQVILCHRDAAGKVRFLSSIMRDISARRQAQTELRRLVQALDGIEEGVFMFAPDSLKFTYVNQGAEKQVGYSEAEMLQMTPVDIKPEFDEAGFREMIAPLIAGPEHAMRFQTLHRHRDGHDIPVEVFLEYVAEADAPPRFVAIVSDITERQRVEQALRASQAQLEQAQQVAHLGSWDLDLTTGKANWSREEYLLLGYPPGAVEAGVESFMARVHPDDRQRVQAEMRAAMTRSDGAYSVEHRVLLPNHEERILLEQGYVSFDGNGTPLRMLGTSLDVTALRLGERRLLEAQRIAHIGSWELDIVHDRLVWSDEIYRIFEMDRHDSAESYEIFLSKVHPEDRDFVDQSYTRSVRDHTPYDIVHRLLMPDGRVKYVHEQCETTYDQEGRPIRSLGTVQDVTALMLAERALRESEERLRLALMAANQGLYDLDLRTGVVVVSPEYARMLGYDPDTYRETIASWRDRLHPEDAPRAYQTFQDYLAGLVPEYKVEFRLRTRGGEWKWILSLGKIQEWDAQGRPVRMLGTHTDISALKQTQEALHQANANLEARVAQRTAELAAANKELEAFSYSVSHDLRAPLRGIDGFSQALLEDYGEQLEGTARDYLQRIRAGAQRMGTLIDDILRLSRVSRARMEPARVDLSAMATAVLEELARQEPERRVQTVVAPGLTALADPGLIHILLQNLLGNAWKYTAKAEPARIEFGAEATHADTVYFVRDNGAGFDMQYADKLFGPFQRLHHPDEFKGSGIGLATAQRIVHRHGGRIWAEAEVGRGAVFRFVLGAPHTPSMARESTKNGG